MKKHSHTSVCEPFAGAWEQGFIVADGEALALAGLQHQAPSDPRVGHITDGPVIHNCPFCGMRLTDDHPSG